MRRYIFSIASIFASVMLLLGSTAAHAMFFGAKSTIGSFSDGYTCDPSRDWCVDVRPGSGTQPINSGDCVTAIITAHTAHDNGIAIPPLTYGTDLVGSSKPFKYGVWYTPNDVKQYEVLGTTIDFNQISTPSGTHPLINCSVSEKFPGYKIMTPGIVHVVISRVSSGNYRCTIHTNPND